VVSESLAKIMVKQGKIEKAVEIYRELICKYPDKKAYFAGKIDELNANT
jgi:pentatricopeptide repeat protein